MGTRTKWVGATTCCIGGESVKVALSPFIKNDFYHSLYTSLTYEIEILVGKRPS